MHHFGSDAVYTYIHCKVTSNSCDHVNVPQNLSYVPNISLYMLFLDEYYCVCYIFFAVDD